MAVCLLVAVVGCVAAAEIDTMSLRVTPATFTPSWSTFFRFEGSTVNITNATTEAEACGFICPGRVDGEAINGTLYLYNASTPALGNRMAGRCFLVVGNTTSETQVCTAYIRYNASYIENGTVYALPINKTVTLDPRTRVIARGYTFPLWLWIELSECPWYYDDPRVLLAQPSSWERATSSVHGTDYENASFYLTTGPRPSQCLVVPNPETGTMRARLTVWVHSYDVLHQWYALNRVAPSTVVNDTTSAGSVVGNGRTNFVAVAFVHVSTIRGIGALSTSILGEIVVLDLMNVSMSPSWWPMENYSVAPLATQPRRCYATDPRAADGSPSTVWEDRTACTVYPGYVVGLHLEFLNATALCCSMPNVTSVVWPSPIEVWVRGERWFVDNAGIAGDASPTAAPGSGGVPPRNYSNTSAPSSPPDAATEAPQGSRSGDGGGESAALVIGVALAAVGGVIAMGAVLYTAVWKRYRAPEEAKAHRDDALRDVMGDHTDEGGASGALEAELLAACGDL